MKRRALVLVSILLSLLLCAGSALAGSTHYDAIDTQGTVRDEYNFKGANPSGTSTYSVDKQGNVNYAGSANLNRNVLINRGTQFSTYSRATAGQSYYQLSPGFTYTVDPYAIGLSGVTAGNGVSMCQFSAWSGVSLILPDASVYSGPQFDVSVRLGTTGDTGYAVHKMGVTSVYVWPFAGTQTATTGATTTALGAGATTYGNTQVKPQTMATGVTNPIVSSGASYWSITREGDNAVFTLYNGGVSASVKDRNIWRKNP